MLGVRRAIEYATVKYVEALASASQYKRSSKGRSIIVCGGWDKAGDAVIASCEELPIDAKGFPGAKSWRSFASLPSARSYGCMMQLHDKVHVCLVAFFT